MKISIASLLSHLIPIDRQFELVKSNAMALYSLETYREPFVCEFRVHIPASARCLCFLFLANARCLFNRNEVDVHWYSLIPLQSLTSALPTKFLSGELFISHS